MAAVTVVGFDDLTAREAYALWRLRQQVFVVEQASPYPDLDGRDLEPATRHVLAHDDDRLVGCARVLVGGDVARVGRVVVHPDARGQRLGDRLVEAALAETGGREVVLDAQTDLVGWYAGFGFEVSGDEFVEDGIPHRPMRRPAQTSE